jgi:hypothetical protein
VGNSFASVPIPRYPDAVRERPVRSDTVAATRKTTATRSKLSEPKMTSCGASAQATTARDFIANGARRWAIAAAQNARTTVHSAT